MNIFKKLSSESSELLLSPRPPKTPRTHLTRTPISTKVKPKKLTLEINRPPLTLEIDTPPPGDSKDAQLDGASSQVESIDGETKATTLIRMDTDTTISKASEKVTETPSLTVVSAEHMKPSSELSSNSKSSSKAARETVCMTGLKVENLSATVTQQRMMEIFGLDKTEYIRYLCSCKMGIDEEAHDQYAGKLFLQK